MNCVRKDGDAEEATDGSKAGNATYSTPFVPTDF